MQRSSPQNARGMYGTYDKHDNQQIKFSIELITVKYHKTTMPYLENGVLYSKDRTNLLHCICDLFYAMVRNVFAIWLARTIIFSRVNLMPDNRQLNRLDILYVFKLDGCCLYRTNNNRIINRGKVAFTRASNDNHLFYIWI